MSTLEVIVVALIVAAAAACVARMAWRSLRRTCGCSGPAKSRPRRAMLTVGGKAIR